MTTLELKTRIKQDIDNEQDSVILKKLQVYYRKLKNKANTPCVMNAEELERDVYKP